MIHNLFMAEAFAAERVRPLRRTEYDRLVAAGAFVDEKIELLYGRLVAMSPQGTPHAHAIQRLSMLLARALDPIYDVRVQLPFAASSISEPEPDLAVVEARDYHQDHPSDADLVVEVAESSLVDDREIKRRLYAESGVPEYWLVNLIDGVVEVYRDPEAGDYLDVSHHERGATIKPQAFPGIAVEVSSLVPPE